MGTDLLVANTMGMISVHPLLRCEKKYGTQDNVFLYTEKIYNITADKSN